MSSKLSWAAFSARLRDSLPVPLAAPETPFLRRARHRVMGALTMLGAVCLMWGWLFALFGIVLVALVAALFVFLAIQIPFWVLAKNKADDAWLMRERDDA